MKQAMRVLGGVACMLTTLTQAAGPLKLDTPMDAPLARAMLARWGYGATDASVAALTGQTPRAMVQRGWRAPSGVAPAVRTALDALADAPPWPSAGRNMAQSGYKKHARREGYSAGAIHGPPGQCHEVGYGSATAIDDGQRKRQSGT